MLFLTIAKKYLSVAAALVRTDTRSVYAVLEFLAPPFVSRQKVEKEQRILAL